MINKLIWSVCTNHPKNFQDELKNSRTSPKFQYNEISDDCNTCYKSFETKQGMTLQKAKKLNSRFSEKQCPRH